MEFIIKAESLLQQQNMFFNQGFAPVAKEYLSNVTEICNEYSRKFKFVKPCCFVNTTELLSHIKNDTCKNEVTSVCPLNGMKDVVNLDSYLVSRPSKATGLKYADISKLFYSTVTDILTHNIAPKEGLIALECKLSKVLGKKARNCIPCSISMPSIVRVDKANKTDLATIHISWKESFSQKSSCTTNHYEAEVWQSNNFGTSNVKKYVLQTSQLRNTSSKDSVTYYFDIIYNTTEGGFIWEFYFRMRAVNNILQDATEWRVSKIYREKASVPPKIVRLNAQPLNNQEYKTLFEILWSCVGAILLQAEVQWSSDIHFQSDKTKSMFVHSYKPIKIWSSLQRLRRKWLEQYCRRALFF